MGPRKRTDCGHLAPLFLGLVADRFFPSEKVMGTLFLIGGALMAYIAILAPQGPENGGLIVYLMIAHMCCFMPTLGLANTITFNHLPQELFPKARVWGPLVGLLWPRSLVSLAGLPHLTFSGSPLVQLYFSVSFLFFPTTHSSTGKRRTDQRPLPTYA